MPARSAASRASLWARTLKPRIGTPDASASVTSDSVMPPTPEWITRAPTSSVASFSIAPMAGAIGGDFAGARLRLHDRQAVAGLGRAVEAEDFGRRRGPRGLDRRAGIGDQRAHAAPIGAGHDEVADTQRAALHQYGRNRSAAAIELGLDHGAFGRTVRVGLEIEDFRLQA